MIRHHEAASPTEVLLSPELIPCPLMPKAGHSPLTAAVPRLLHTPLWGFVDFVRYPRDPPAPPTPAARDRLTRLFMGQLPLGISERQLNYAVWLSTGVTIYHMERIFKRGHPTGCVHVYAQTSDAEKLIQTPCVVLHDEDGFWLPRDASQIGVIRAYRNWFCAAENRAMRPAVFPFQAMTIEPAHSSFVPAGLPAGRAAAAAGGGGLLPPPVS
jgi:hypothetical protein